MMREQKAGRRENAPPPGIELPFDQNEYSYWIQKDWGLPFHPYVV